MFRKYVENIQVSLKPDKNNVYFKLRSLYIYDFAQFFLRILGRMRNVSDKSCEIQTFFSRKSCHSWDDMAHAHCKLDTWGYKHTHTQSIHCLSCSYKVYW